MTVEKDNPLLQVATLPEVEKEEVGPEPEQEFLQIGELDEHGKRKVSDRQYVFNHATADDFARLRKEIEKRKADQPKFLFFRCTDAKCNYRTRVPYREGLTKGKVACIYCNKVSDRKGGFWKEMSKSEIAAWEADKAAAMKATAPAREAAQKARIMAEQAELSKIR